MGYRSVFTRLFLLVAAVLGIVGLLFAVSTMVFVQRASTAAGTVSGYERVEGMAAPFVSGGGAGVVFYPTVEFRTPDGNRRVFTSTVGRHRPEPAIGEPVRIRYLPDRTGNERIDSPIELWGRSLIFGGLGILFALIGLLAPRSFAEVS